MALLLNVAAGFHCAHAAETSTGNAQSNNIGSNNIGPNSIGATSTAPVAATTTAASTGGDTDADDDMGDSLLTRFGNASAVQKRLAKEGWLLHSSVTFIEQMHPGFPSPYSGPASMGGKAQAKNTLSIDVVLGRKLWKGAEIIAVPQFSRGFGFSETEGAAAFPNGEAFRLGSNHMSAYFTRIFFRQTFALSGEMVPSDPDPMHFPGAVPKERITLTAGKISVFDIFDDNRYAHDPRTQFQNWAFLGAGAVDYAADARGYTNGVALEWDNGTWGVRGGAFMVARYINSLSLEPHFGRGWQTLLEVDRFWQLNNHPGALRLIAGASRVRTAHYSDMTDALVEDGITNYVDLRHFNTKPMLALNFEQELTSSLGVFGRLSWNNGVSEEAMYTEMDRAASFGLSLNGKDWGRPNDTIGAAVNVATLSSSHRRYLEAGGIGFITGDGRLNYRPEVAFETYYDAQIIPGLNAAADFQLIANPAYNADRGPIPVFSLRVHAAF